MNKPAIILLAEDKKAEQRLLERAFKEGNLLVDLKIVQNGEEALDYLHRQGSYAMQNLPEPDLLLLDLNMPRKDGKEVLKAIRANQRLKHLPVIILSTTSDERTIVEMYELGVNSFVTKPADLEGLIQFIHSLENYWFIVARLPHK